MRVLITGETGLVGSHLTGFLSEKEIEVNYLTTSRTKIEKVPGYNGFYWNPTTGEIEDDCLAGVDAIFHLAGANLAARWTDKYKKEIIESRVKSANLLRETINTSSHKVAHFISASGVGVYPDSLLKLYNEDEKAIDHSFPGEVVQKWEEAAWEFEDLDMKVSIIRTGMVLAKEGGALPKMKEPASYYAGAAFGSGKQWQSWIHIDDLTGIYAHVLENELEGIFNAVAPNPVTNKELVNCLAEKLEKPLWLPNIPKVALRIALGEMATIVLSSQRVSSEKIENTGYFFKYNNLSKALEDLI